MPSLDDEAFTHLRDKERRREEKFRSSRPAVQFLGIAAVILAVVVAGSLGLRSWLDAREVASCRTYLSQVADLAKRTNDVGAHLVSLINDPGTLTRKDVQTRLEEYTKMCSELAEETAQLRPPAPLADPHRWLLASMQLRIRGMEEFTPAVMNSLEVQDIDIAASQISRAMQKLVLADLCYSEFFVTPATEVIKTQGILDIGLVATSFLGNDDLASKSSVVSWLTAFKSAEQLQAVHGVALTQVIAKPSNTTITAGDTFNLPSSDQLRFVVTVENQGNMTETDVPVTLRLQGPDSAQPQIVTVKIEEIKAKQTKEVEIKGVNPTSYGEKALLRIEVGPVPNEKNQDNNSLEAYIIFGL